MWHHNCSSITLVGNRLAGRSLPLWSTAFELASKWARVTTPSRCDGVWFKPVNNVATLQPWGSGLPLLQQILNPGFDQFTEFLLNYNSWDLLANHTDIYEKAKNRSWESGAASTGSDVTFEEWRATGSWLQPGAWLWRSGAETGGPSRSRPPTKIHWPPNTDHLFNEIRIVKRSFRRSDLSILASFSEVDNVK